MATLQETGHITNLLPTVVVLVHFVELNLRLPRRRRTESDRVGFHLTREIVAGRVSLSRYLMAWDRTPGRCLTKALGSHMCH